MNQVERSSKLVALWDSTQPLVESTTVGWVFDRTTWSMRMPDPKRHRGRGNVLFFDGHCESLLPGDISIVMIRFDNKG
jgi:prepilin-type processing-associated H-X9-DG protein